MSGDPFSDLSDSVQDRRDRENQFRSQKKKEFWRSVTAALLFAISTGVGSAAGGAIEDRNTDLAVDRFLGGVVCGLLGGIFAFLLGIWVIVGAWTKGEESEDPGAFLFWFTVTATAFFGILGGSQGLWNLGRFSSAAAVGASSAVLLSLIPLYSLRRALRSRNRTGSTRIVFEEDE